LLTKSILKLLINIHVNQGEGSLAKTIDSLAALEYDDKHKLIFVIADGMIIGSGNDRPTPRIVLDILGVDPLVEPDSFAFESLGDGNKQLNYGKVYAGLYETQGHVVPYVVVVKVGKPSERNRPGNRYVDFFESYYPNAVINRNSTSGKRDSQMILMRFLSRVHFNQAMSPLELELYHQMKNVIGVDPSYYEFIFSIDADTEVYPSSLNSLVAHMFRDSKIIGICGETELANEKKSWVTMIQVYEYFISHHLSKAFESMFGTVTCLPGCFSMFRIRTPVKNIPLLVSPSLVSDYSRVDVDTLHLKNLLHLGEDRYLTTLLLKHFPRMRTTFVHDAKCKTNAPESFSVLLSQRRRWINSTVHNLVELLRLPDLCGACCFNLRFVVFIDLFATFTQPAAIIYIGYLIYSLSTDSTTVFPFISLVMLAAIFGLQIIIFLMRGQWQHIFWMIFVSFRCFILFSRLILTYIILVHPCHSILCLLYSHLFLLAL
jgi:chitin synthase